MGTPIRLVINLSTADEAAGDAFAAEWPDRLAEVQAEPGCLQYELCRSVSHPENFAVLEVWADREAFNTHWALEQQRTPVGTSHLDPTSRHHGRNGAEIYWEQQYWRWDPDSSDWVQR